MVDCLFCRIVAGEIPATIVFQDENVVAFRDIAAQAPVHILLVPRAHLTGVAAVTEDNAELLGALMLAASRVARAEGVADSGYRLVINQGADANQTVAHLHVHLLGGRVLSWPPG